MKKLTTVFCILVMTATSAFSQVATLMRDGEIVGTYYNVDALKSALAAAQTGDVINLSSGIFNCNDINKAVTIIGAGMESDPETGTPLTRVKSSGSSCITQSNPDNQLKMEGIYFTGYWRYSGVNYGWQIVKCKFEGKLEYKNYNSDKIVDGQFYNCLFMSSSSILGTCSFVSCYFEQIPYYNNGTHTFLNCVMNAMGSNEAYTHFVFMNSIAINTNCGWTNNLQNAESCVGMTTCTEIDRSPIAVSHSVKTYAALFKTFNGTYTEGEMFELTDEAAATMLGNDGTQVGMHGGVLGYDPRPTNLRIENCTVDKQTDANGKLNVSIKLKQ